MSSGYRPIPDSGAETSPEAGELPALIPYPNKDGS